MLMLSLLLTQSVGQSLTGEFEIRGKHESPSMLSLPIEHKASEFNKWEEFISGNWYSLENECVRLKNNEIICNKGQIKDD